MISLEQKKRLSKATPPETILEVYRAFKDEKRCYTIKEIANMERISVATAVGIKERIDWIEEHPGENWPKPKAADGIDRLFENCKLAVSLYERRHQAVETPVKTTESMPDTNAGFMEYARALEEQNGMLKEKLDRILFLLSGIERNTRYTSMNTKALETMLR